MALGGAEAQARAALRGGVAVPAHGTHVLVDLPRGAGANYLRVARFMARVVIWQGRAGALRAASAGAVLEHVHDLGGLTFEELWADPEAGATVAILAMGGPVRARAGLLAEA